MRGDDFFALAATRPPLSRLHPKLAAFFKGYFAHEKVVRFGDRYVVNTHFPPFPSRAFDHLAEGFIRLGDADSRHLYSVTWAVTNCCPYACWHCYNAGRRQHDLPLDVMGRIAGELRAHGAIMVTLTGGEPLLRDDLEEVARLFDDRVCLIVGTTGTGLSAGRARRLRDAGVFGMGISLDSRHEAEHDRMRGHAGAFRVALDALGAARDTGLYPYVVSVATHAFLQPDHFEPFVHLITDAGALELHVLEPFLVGRLAGRTDLRLTAGDRRRLFEYQRRLAADDRLPILSSYAYLESEDAFGCGAGLTQLYIDGSGEVCPCQVVPLSFGNAATERFGDILERMGRCFRRPRATCVGCRLAEHVPAGALPTPPDTSAALCERHLPKRHALPRFYRVHTEAQDTVGRAELRSAYDRVHAEYDDHWLSQAAEPIDDLLRALDWRGSERVFEAGCGTGYATARLARRAASVLAVDLSEGMLREARRRLHAAGLGGVRFVAGDALEMLAGQGLFDVVFSSWVLGYIPLGPFFNAVRWALSAGGRVAFIVHKDHSPRESLEIFAELVARDPSVLTKRVAFDFPRDRVHLETELAQAGLTIEQLREGTVSFSCHTPRAVLDHLLKSGAGTAFHDAVVSARRRELERDFMTALAKRWPAAAPYEVHHDYFSCVARMGRETTGARRTQTVDGE